MKNLLLLFVILITACTPLIEKDLLPNEKEMVFEHQTKLSKAELKTRLIMFVNEGFHSGKAVIQSNEDGLLTGNYTTFLANLDALGYIKYFGEFTFLFKYSDNNYKLKVLIKNIYSFKEGRNDGDLPPRLFGTYSEQIVNEYKRFDATLNDYLSSNNTF